MIVTIHQVEHLSYLGLLDKIRQADLLILGDDFQFKKNYFENRNRIRTDTSQGWEWVTVPVQKHNHIPMNQVQISKTDWKETYLRKIKYAYEKSQYFADYFPGLREVIESANLSLLELNKTLLLWLLEEFDIHPEIRYSSEFNVPGLGTQRLRSLCEAARADTYLSGCSGQDYLDQPEFQRAEIPITFHSFLHPTYPQTSLPFIQNMSSIDLLFNCGPLSREILQGRGIQGKSVGYMTTTGR